MKILFDDLDLKELVTTGKNRKYKKYQRDTFFMNRLHKTFKYMENANSTAMLTQISPLHYEKLRGLGISYVRISNSYPERIIFRETDDGIVVTILEMNTTHYGNKK